MFRMMPLPTRDLRYSRDFNGATYQSIDSPHVCESKNKTRTIITGYQGIWKRHIPNYICPSPRHGAFYIRDEDENCIYIGYGIINQSEFFDDVWKLNLNNSSWEKLVLKGDVVGPRTGTRGIKVHDYLVLFGGFYNGEYLSDLHRINIKTGEVSRIRSNGNEPTPRSTFVAGFYERKFYIWGGFNGNWPSELNYFSFDDFTWYSFPSHK